MLRKKFQLADIHGLIEVIVTAIPQADLVDHYYKNLPFDDSDVEVTSRVTIHEKRRNNLDNMKTNSNKQLLSKISYQLYTYMNNILRKTSI